MTDRNDGTDAVDFGIITVREDEYQAVFTRLEAPRPVVRRHRTYVVADVPNAHGETYRVALVRCIEQGPGAAQSVARDVLEDLDPAWLALVGIAGAFTHDEFTLGDVVVASRLHDFSVSAHSADVEYVNQGGPMHRTVEDFTAAIGGLRETLAGWETPSAVRTARPGIDLDPANFYGDDATNRVIAANVRTFFGGRRNRDYPIVTTRAVASSGTLVKSTALMAAWRRSSRDVQVVEMELAGVYAAARRIEGDRPILAIRGISDIVGFRRDPAWTAYACNTAASLFFAMLRTLPREMLRLPPSERRAVECGSGARAVDDGAELPPPHDHVLTVTPNPHFESAVRSLAPGSGQTIAWYATAFMHFDRALNLQLDRARTFVRVDTTEYRPPAIEALDARQGVLVQKTTYCNGLTTNELATEVLRRSRSDTGSEELRFVVFDNHVARYGRLIRLSESRLSNHIGGTTLLVTADNYLLVQRQGETLVDHGRFMVGASGSSDWSDIEASAKVVDDEGRPRVTLQNVAKYAIEREAAEERSVTTGPGHSKTTITGFARNINRGGKPDFTFITFLAQTYESIPKPIRASERKFVHAKHDRLVDAGSVSALIAALDALESEVAESGDGSASMMVTIDFAKHYLAHSGRTLAELRP